MCHSLYGVYLLFITTTWASRCSILQMWAMREPREVGTSNKIPTFFFLYGYRFGESTGKVGYRMVLPKWLDDLIFRDLHAVYSPSYGNMTNIDDDKEKTLNYLGTYFPRSYVESYCIFSEFFKKNPSCFTDKEVLSIFDFGSGTGGEIIGLLTAIGDFGPHLQCVNILALDGNQYALRCYERIIEKTKEHISFQVDSTSSPIVIDDFYDLSILDTIITSGFDMIISFKAICEFAAKQQFDEENPYEHIVKFFLPKLNDGGLILLEDITTKDNVSKQWLPQLMDNGLQTTNCSLLGKNEGYNQEFSITHSHRQNDTSKVAWRMIKPIRK